MITLKEVEKDERWATTVIKNFMYDHPIFVTFISTILLIFVLSALSIIMMLAATGGGLAEQNANTRYLNGEITAQEYHTFSVALDVAVFCYNFIDALVGFVVGLYILILSYGAFKYYLKYNKDNL